MPDQYLETAAALYGVPLWVLEGIANSEGATWDTVSTAGEVGRFQIHPVHANEIQQKYGITMQELASRPDIQINYWAPRIADAWKGAKAQGMTDEQAAQVVVANVQAPAEQYRAREVSNIMAARGQSADVTAGTTLQPPAPTQQAGQGTTGEQVIAWMQQFFQDQTNYGVGGKPETWTAAQQASEAFAENPSKWLDLWKSETQGTSGLAPEEAAYKTAETAKIYQEMGDFDRLVSMDERKEKRLQGEADIAAGRSTWEEAVAKFNSWLSATGEARLRAEAEFGVAEKRALYTRPEATFERPAHRQVMEGYGLTYTPEQGVPVEQLPSLEGTYNKWQQNMGAPLQAPSFPSNGGSAGPIDAMGGAATQLAGPSETQNFIQELLRKHALRVGQLPGMAHGGFVSEHRPFIAGERGPEVIQPTNTGTAVTPIVGPGGENPESMAQLRRPTYGAYEHRPDYGRLLEGHHRRIATQYQRWQTSGRF